MVSSVSSVGGREDCVTCEQGGEEIQPCNKASLVYENICMSCNPEARKKGEFKDHNTNQPSIYIGETSRSMHERSLEHWGAFRGSKEESHIFKHQQNHHQGAPPKFFMKVVSFHGSALERQVKIAVRIRRRGGEGDILNFKAEFNRCRIPRLVLEAGEE